MQNLIQHLCISTDMREGFVYIMSNYERTALYVGVTSDLEWRVLEHKQGKGSRFTSKYKAFYLLYFERFPMITQAIEREKQLKGWRRIWKIDLIKTLNPQLRDLAADWFEKSDIDGS